MSTLNTGSIPVIKTTTDYTFFKWIKGNRHIKPAHVRNFKEAISTDATSIKYNPILVNEKQEIVDGQHRFEAIKELKLPVYYIQVDELDLKSAQLLNQLSKPWSPKDYAESYQELGNQNYAIYLEMKAIYGFNHDIMMRYLALDNPITGEMFRAGKFKVKNKAKSIDLCNKLQEIAEFYPRYATRSFALAFKQLWDNPKYDHERLKLKLRQKPNAIQDRGVPEEYMRDLERIYNHHINGEYKIRIF